MAKHILDELTGSTDANNSSSGLVSGSGLVHYLRKNEYGGKIIVISGFLTPELLTEYRSKRVDNILQKAFSVTELSSMLSETFKAWQADGESFISGIPSPSRL